MRLTDQLGYSICLFYGQGFHPYSTEKENNNKDRSIILSGKYLKIIVAIPTGQSLQDRITEMKDRKPECACFESDIHNPLNILEDRFKCLSIDVHPVVFKH